MLSVGFIMRDHPESDNACLVGGGVKNPYRQLRALRDRVHVVGVLVADRPGRFRTHGYNVFGWRTRPLKLYVRTLVWNALSLRRVLRMFSEADVVQCHHPHYGLGAIVARRLFRGTRLIVKAHGTATPELKANRYRGMKGAVLLVNARLHLMHDRHVLRQADMCLVSSNYQLSEMTEVYGVDRSRLRRIYNGVDPGFLRVRSRTGENAVTAPRFLFVGRVVPKKGYEHLRGLYVSLRRRFPGASLTLVLGHASAIEDRATYKFIMTAIAPLPGCRVLFDQSEDELFQIISDSDVGLVTSQRYESIPTVLLEMCAAGLPAFSTYDWGVPEVLPRQFGLTGDLTADVDRVATFIESDLMEWDSEAVARDYEQFHYSKLASQYCAVYEEVLGHEDPSHHDH